MSKKLKCQSLFIRNLILFLPGQVGEQWKPSPWLCRSLISIHYLWLIHWALTKTGARGLCNLIHVEYFGKNIGQLGVSNDYLEIYLGYLKLFCASMNYFWLLVLFLETEFIPAGCNDSSLMLMLSLLWSCWFFYTP